MTDRSPKDEMLLILNDSSLTAAEVEELFLAMMKRVRRGRRTTSKKCRKRGHPLEGANIRLQIRIKNGQRVQERGGCRLCYRMDEKLRRAGFDPSADD